MSNENKVQDNNLIYFKNEVLQDIKEIETKLNLKFQLLQSEYEKKFSEYDKKMSATTDKLASISTSFTDQSSLVESVNKLNAFKTKTEENFSSQNSKMGIIDKELKNSIEKYDKLITTSIFYAGVVGPGCKFGTLHEFIDYVLENFEQFTKFKNEQLSLDLKTYKRKLEKMIERLNTEMSTFVETSNKYADTKIAECIEQVNTLLSQYDDRFNELKLQDAQIKVISEQADQNLQNEIEKLSMVAKERDDELNKEILFSKQTEERIKFVLDKHLSDVNPIKKKISDLFEIIKTLAKETKSKNLEFAMLDQKIKNNHGDIGLKIGAESKLKDYISGKIDMQGFLRKNSVCIDNNYINFNQELNKNTNNKEGRRLSYYKVEFGKIDGNKDKVNLMNNRGRNSVFQNNSSDNYNPNKFKSTLSKIQEFPQKNNSVNKNENSYLENQNLFNNYNGNIPLDNKGSIIGKNNVQKSEINNYIPIKNNGVNFKENNLVQSNNKIISNKSKINNIINANIINNDLNNISKNNINVISNSINNKNRNENDLSYLNKSPQMIKYPIDSKKLQNNFSPEPIRNNENLLRNSEEKIASNKKLTEAEKTKNVINKIKNLKPINSNKIVQYGYMENKGNNFIVGETGGKEIKKILKGDKSSTLALNLCNRTNESSGLNLEVKNANPSSNRNNQLKIVNKASSEINLYSDPKYKNLGNKSINKKEVLSIINNNNNCTLPILSEDIRYKDNNGPHFHKINNESNVQKKTESRNHNNVFDSSNNNSGGPLSLNYSGKRNINNSSSHYQEQNLNQNLTSNKQIDYNKNFSGSSSTSKVNPKIKEKITLDASKNIKSNNNILVKNKNLDSQEHDNNQYYKMMVNDDKKKQ